MSQVKDFVRLIHKQGGSVNRLEFIRALKTAVVDNNGAHFGNLRSELTRRGLIKHNHTIELTPKALELIEGEK